MPMSFVATYDSPVGRIVIRSSDGISLNSLTFDNDAGIENNEMPPVFREAFRWLDGYFNGKNEKIPPLSLDGTEFQQKVWRELMKIPFGSTVTYGEIAARVGCKCARAVGSAIGRNPVLLMIPCHRVVSATGLGGFSAGPELKSLLLVSESRFFLFKLKVHR